MRVRLTFDFDENARRLFRRWRGKAGLASRKDLGQWIDALVDSTFQVIVSEVANEAETERSDGR